MDSVQRVYRLASALQQARSVTASPWTQASANYHSHDLAGDVYSGFDVGTKIADAQAGDRHWEPE